jgi:hypothetical protein
MNKKRPRIAFPLLSFCFHTLIYIKILDAEENPKHYQTKAGEFPT